ncbi:MAG TPA: TlpA disulfide reductase family protein [Ginsengibacter sp.]
MKKMYRKKYLIVAVIILFIQNNLKSQVLNIGDTVPNINFTLVNYIQQTAKLYDFTAKGKFVLIDFWATWCASCLQHFPKLDSLQKQYGKNLQILLVNSKDTRDTKEKIIKLFANRRTPGGEKYQELPTVILDTVMMNLFPHNGIPHYVWIDKKNIVQAITSSEQLTNKNIQLFLSGIKLNLPIKKDLEYNFMTPLFINGNGGDNEKYLYRSLLTGYVEGLAGSGFFVDDNQNTIRLVNANGSILSMYKFAYPELAKFPENRIKLNVTNLEKYDAKGFNYDTWKYNNSYCYELITPPTNKEHAIEMMRDDLKRYFGLKVYTEKENVMCFVLKLINKMPDSLAKTNISETNIWDNDYMPKYMHNRQISELVRFLNRQISTPVIDETNCKKNISINGLPMDLTDISKLQIELKKHGFELIKEKRELEFFVLEEKKWKGK